jgi:hypothetical protein
MGEITATDKGLIDMMKTHRVFVPITDSDGAVASQFKDVPRCAIYVGCPDADQLKSVMTFHGQTLGQKLHPSAPLHGGLASFHPDSPMHQDATPFPLEWMLEQIHMGMKVKQTNRVAGYSHFQCAMAKAKGVNFGQLLELHFFNQQFLQDRLREKYGREIPDITVRGYVQVDYGLMQDGVTKRKRTYYADADRWIATRIHFADDIKGLPYRLPNPLAA